MQEIQNSILDRVDVVYFHTYAHALLIQKKKDPYTD